MLVLHRSRTRWRHAHRSGPCRTCADLTRFVTDIVAVLGDDWQDQCSGVAGYFTAHHHDGRRIKFYPPHNTRSRIATAYLEVPGEFDYVTDGSGLELPMDVDPAAAAEALVRMPIERRPGPDEPGRPTNVPLQVSMRARLGRLRTVLQKGGATVGEIRQHSFNTGCINAVGPFGDALIVVDADGLVRMTVHKMPEGFAAAALATFATSTPV